MQQNVKFMLFTSFGGSYSFHHQSDEALKRRLISTRLYGEIYNMLNPEQVTSRKFVDVSSS